MKFRYPLQKVVDLKSNQRTQAEWLLAEAIGVFNKRQTTFDQLQLQIRQTQQEMDQATQGASPISRIQMLQEHLNYLQLQLGEEQIRLQQAEKKMEQTQQKLTDKMRDEKVWTTSKDNAYSRFVAEQQKKEQQDIDELASARSIRA